MGGHASSAPRLVSQCVKLLVRGKEDRGGAEWQGRGQLGRPGGRSEALAAEAPGLGGVSPHAGVQARGGDRAAGPEKAERPEKLRQHEGKSL